MLLRITHNTGCGIIENSKEVQGMKFFIRVLPIGLAFAGTLSTGNSVYLYLDVGFIQMLKSFTPVIIIIFLTISGVEIPSTAVLISVFTISFGTAITCGFSPNVTILGLLLMFSSQCFEALRLVLTQFLLKDMKLGVIEGESKFKCLT